MVIFNENGHESYTYSSPVYFPELQITARL